jgi:Bacterial tandem repeat domain 1
MHSISRIALCALLMTGCANVDEGDPVETIDEVTPVSADAVPYVSDVLWVSRSPMTAATYLSEKATWEEAGYLLMDISAYPIDGAVRYAAIWEKNGGPLRKSEHLQTAAQLTSNNATYSQLGYRLKILEPYESAGQARYAAIWEQVTGSVERKYSTQLSAAQYNTEYTTLTQQGYRLLMIDGYTLGGVEYFATVWDKAVGAELQPRVQMTSAQYQSNFTTFASLGYRLKHVSAYKLGAADRFAAIWEKTAGAGYVSHHAMPAL